MVTPRVTHLGLGCILAMQDILPDAATAVRKATEALRTVYPEDHDLVSEQQ